MAPRKASAQRHDGPDARPSAKHGGPSPTLSITRVALIAVIALAVAAGVVVTLLITQVSQCSNTDEAAQTPTQEQEWQDPYVWDNMRNDENGLLAYYDDEGNKLSEAGIDVSEHDGSIDWQAVKDAGVDFAFIRLGYRGYSQGGINLDEQFYNNITGASAAGIKVGIYFFSQAISADEAKEEADFVISTLQSVNVTLSYPIAFDEELNPGGDGATARTDGLTNDQLTENARAFLETVTDAGYDAMLYGNQKDLARLDLTGDLAQYEIWYAEYKVDHPTGHYDMAIWQYTETGTVSGLTENEGHSDIDIRFIGKG